MSETVRISVDISKMQNELAAIAERAQNMRPFLRAVGNVIIKSTHDNFAAQGRPKWKDWSTLTKKIYGQQATDDAFKKGGTLKSRQKRLARNMEILGNRLILTNNGDLRKSIMVGRVTSNSIEVGSSVIYSRIHQLGGIIKPKKKSHLFIPMGSKYIAVKQVEIPARPFLKLQESELETIKMIAGDFILRGAVG